MLQFWVLTDVPSKFSSKSRVHATLSRVMAELVVPVLPEPPEPPVPLLPVPEEGGGGGGGGGGFR